MKNSVEAVLQALLEARSMALGEQRMDELFHAILANPKQAADLYYRQPDGLLQLVWAMPAIDELLPVLRDALRNRDSYVRWAAIESLKRFRSPDLVPDFEAAAKDRSSRVRDVAKKWLARRGGRRRDPAGRPRRVSPPR